MAWARVRGVLRGVAGFSCKAPWWAELTPWGVAGLRTESLEGAGAQLGKKMAKTTMPSTICWASTPSSHSPFSPFFPFMRSEGLVGCRGQKAFTEKVKLQSDLKDSSKATFPLEVDKVGTSVEILYFWSIFYKLPFQSSLFSSISLNSAQLFVFVIFALRFTSISWYIWG